MNADNTANSAGPTADPSNDTALAQRHWDYYIWPRIEPLTRDVVLDLGCGYGAVSALLAANSGRVIAADADAERLAACRARFAAAALTNVDCLLLDGASLVALEDASVTLVLSWHRLVFADPDTVERAVAESARVLRPGGCGFFHHSNRMNDAMQDPRDEPAGRHYLSQQVLRFLARRHGLVTLAQTAIDWDESAPPARRWQRRAGLLPALDAISLLQKQKS